MYVYRLDAFGCLFEKVYIVFLRGVPVVVIVSGIARETTQTLAEIRARHKSVVRVEPVSPQSFYYASRCIELVHCAFFVVEARACMIEAHGPDEYLRFVKILKGFVRIEHGGAQALCAEAQGFVLLPAAARQTHLSNGCKFVMMRVERTALCRELRAYGMEDELVAPHIFAPESATVARLNTIIRQFWTWMNEGSLDVSDSSRYRAARDNFILASLADALAPRNGGNGATSASTHPAISASLNYIEQSFAAPLVPTELAEHVGMSLRSLQILFRRHCDCTITQYVLSVRLARARDKLSAPHAGESVASIARDSGFRHLGDFAAAYLKKYGERPSETLREAART